MKVTSLLAGSVAIAGVAGFSLNFQDFPGKKLNKNFQDFPGKKLNKRGKVELAKDCPDPDGEFAGTCSWNLAGNGFPQGQPNAYLKVNFVPDAIECAKATVATDSNRNTVYLLEDAGTSVTDRSFSRTYLNHIKLNPSTDVDTLTVTNIDGCSGTASAEVSLPTISDSTLCSWSVFLRPAKAADTQNTLLGSCTNSTDVTNTNEVLCLVSSLYPENTDRKGRPVACDVSAMLLSYPCTNVETSIGVFANTCDFDLDGTVNNEECAWSALADTEHNIFDACWDGFFLDQTTKSLDLKFYECCETL